jgi:hypothetical protein
MKNDTEDGVKDLALYIVITESHEPKEDGAKIKQTDYRVLAGSVIEAAEIVANSCHGVDETVTESRKASHITKLPSDKYRVKAI